MNKELYINGSFIELSDQSKIGLTIQANTLSDLQTRQGNFSSEFIVPFTPANQQALELSNNINSDTTIPYKLNGVKYLEDGIEIIFDGFAIIKSASAGYSVSIYSGNLDFFSAVGDALLTDLDLSDLDHTYTLANVLASYPNTGGYIYSQIDFRKIETTLSPSNMGRSAFMFVHTLIERISDAIGYALAGDLLLDDYYINMILTTNFRHSEAWQESTNSSTSLTAPNTISTIIGAPITSVYNIGFPTSGHITGGIYVAPEALSASFSASIPIQFGLTGSGSQFADSASIQIVNITTATILDADTINPNTDIGGGAERFYTFQVNASSASYSPGDQIQIRFEQVYSAIGLYRWTYLVGSIYGSNVSVGFIPYLGGDVNVSEIQHDMKQTEFVKGILNMFCAVPQVNVATKTLTINKLNDIQANIPNALDWSRKVDVKRGMNISYRDTAYSQNNLVKYSNDPEVVAEVAEWVYYTTDGVIVSPDETLDKEKTIVQLPFSGTISTNRIPYKNNDFSIDVFTPRVLRLGRFYFNIGTGTTSYYPTQEGSHFQPNGGYETLSMYDGGASRWSFIRNYSTIEGILENYKGVSLFVNLNSVDILNIDFLIPIYLDIHTADIQVNGYFYLNKVENYKGGESTKCELIRL